MFLVITYFPQLHLFYFMDFMDLMSQILIKKNRINSDSKLLTGSVYIMKKARYLKNNILYFQKSQNFPFNINMIYYYAALLF